MSDKGASSRFAAFARTPARLLIALLIALMAYGAFAATRARPPQPVIADARAHDADLYRAIAARVAAGESYYPAAAAEQRARGFPLKPFVTMRPPLLAEVTALAGDRAMGWGLRALVLATLITMIVRLRASIPAPSVRLAAIALAALALVVIAQPDLAVWHEAWAACLVTVSLALRRPGRWGASLACALIAALLRELAIPFLLVMAACAMIERQAKEAAAWAAALVIAGAALAVHAAHVAAVVTAADPASQGWTQAGGWPFVLVMMGKASAFALLPAILTAILVPLALLGWAGWRASMGLRGSLWITGMIAVFMLIGRPENFYWGLLIAPLLPIGLALAPAVLRDLAKAARRDHGTPDAG